MRERWDILDTNNLKAKFIWFHQTRPQKHLATTY